jgi:hypothetical protein
VIQILRALDAGAIEMVGSEEERRVARLAA